jgi:hypothetical protein
MRGTVWIASRNASRIAALALLLPMLASAGEPAPDPGAIVQTPATYRSVTGRLDSVGKDQLVVEQFSATTGAHQRLRFAGGGDVKVAGKKESWFALRRGDLVTVIWDSAAAVQAPLSGRVVKVTVMDPTEHPAIARLIGVEPPKHGRVFTGWVKQKTGDSIVVRTPDGPPPGGHKGEVLVFARTEKTKVEVRRSSWDEIKKGDRVTVHYGKGRPRPAERIQVVLKGGEKPLPPGLATRLFDPRYDHTVKDVDGIGEVPPGAEWKPPADGPRGAGEAGKGAPAGDS